MTRASPARHPFGKASHDLLEQVVYRNLGAGRPGIIIGPRRGFDNAVVAIGGSKVLILTTDPVSMIPSLGPSASAWLGVHLIASDYTTSGLSPEFASFNFNFPSAMTAADRKAYLVAVSAACKELGVAIVAGHTGSYPGAGFTVIGGGTMFGLGTREGYVDPSMARAGDAVVMTKGAAIEATATLAASFPRHTSALVGRGFARRARDLVRSCSTVRDARSAAALGLGASGVTSMHDATEGGVLGGLEEMAGASGNSIKIEKERILLSDEVAAVCRAFNIDPLSALSEGTLLATCAEKRANELVDLLGDSGISAARIGRVEEGTGLWMSEGGGPHRRVKTRRDPYWDAYARASKAGLD